MLHDSYFTLSFIARKSRALRNGEYPIFVRITVSGQISEMNLGRSVAPENWDQKRAMSKGRSRRDLELNKYIEVVKARFLEIHNMLVREGKMVNPKILRDHFLGTVEKPKMLCDVFREANEKRKEELDRGDIVKATYQRWTRCVDYLEEFLRLTQNMEDIPIKDVTSGLIDDFEHFLRMKKSCANNAAVRYIRCVKNVMQYAMAHKWITHDPFIGKKYQRTYTERQYLTENELKSVMELDLKALPRLEVVRDTFVFCCFTGLAFCDIKSLLRSNITTDSEGNTWIRKAREKTGEMSIIPMLAVPPKDCGEICRTSDCYPKRCGTSGHNQPEDERISQGDSRSCESGEASYNPSGATYLCDTVVEQPCTDRKHFKNARTFRHTHNADIRQDTGQNHL